ncbi:crossover junction endodeoxyribonuclease RuvC [Candidatus Kaiserbacteria bacterium]|nr:crossover junction endodeoxyribonuclease RuvC [Candidatus Kaiserbacteria bacterium]
MKVLAIDPGYDRCGVAILERQKTGDVLLYSSCITTSARAPFAERLGVVGAAVESLIKKFKPSSIAIENLYFNTNQKTAMHVAEVRGAIIYIATAAGIPVYEYTPPQVKSAVAGWGRADKKQMMAMLPKLIHIDKKIQHDDEYDAIALGITHLASVRHP